MDPSRDEPLEPELKQATKKLSEALDEACRTDVKKADTGEMVRVEEVLAIANDAAKAVVSIRRRRSQRRMELRDRQPDAAAEGARRERSPDDAEPGSTAEALDVTPPGGHRVFRDAAGVRWEAFAVYPHDDTQARARLPHPFRNGWLTFESVAEKRRLSPVPDDWDQLREAGLRELCQRAERVPLRTGVRSDDRSTDR